MKKIFLLLLATLFSASVTAQSGRRIKTPPPPTPTEPAVVEPSVAQPNRQPTTQLSGESLILPQSFFNRQIQSLDSGSLRLADYDDKVIVVNLWATWCGPCRMEVPDYERVRKEYVGRSVEFIALTPEDPNTSSDRVKKFVRNFNFGFRQGWADRQTAAMLMNGKNVLPQTLVIAPGRRIVAHWRGYSRGQSGDRLREAIEHALSESSVLVQRLQ
jgi:thiol-disulfide isomerase/thioredoxin